MQLAYDYIIFHPLGHETGGPCMTCADTLVIVLSEEHPPGIVATNG